jgi:hypothetical protein
LLQITRPQVAPALNIAKTRQMHLHAAGALLVVSSTVLRAARCDRLAWWLLTLLLCQRLKYHENLLLFVRLLNHTSHTASVSVRQQTPLIQRFHFFSKNGPLMLALQNAVVHPFTSSKPTLHEKIKIAPCR